MSVRKYDLVSLFSGAGGFDWGFYRTRRFQTRLACELLKEPAETLAHNLGLAVRDTDDKPYTLTLDKDASVVIRGDVCQVDFSQVNLEPDVLVGGPPCQDFSVVIVKKGQGPPGLDGGRGKLYIEFARAIMFFQPKFFVFENVPGLIGANEGKAQEIILNDFKNLEDLRLAEQSKANGYQVPAAPIQDYQILFSEVVDATTVGVPQRRMRFIVIGIREDIFGMLNRLDQEQIERELSAALHGERTTFAQFPLTCLEVFEGKPLPELEEKYREVMEAYSDIWKVEELASAKSWKERVWDRLTWDIRKDYFDVNQIEPSLTNLDRYEDAMYDHEGVLASLGWRNKPVYGQEFADETNAPSRITQSVIDRMYMIPPDENYAFVDGTQWKVKGKGISLIYRRSHPLKPAWTVLAYGGGGTYGYHYERERAQLTLRERARLQTFTDDFEFKSSGVRAQIGEAVPPLMSQRIAEEIARMLDKISDKFPQER